MKRLIPVLVAVSVFAAACGSAAKNPQGTGTDKAPAKVNFKETEQAKKVMPLAEMKDADKVKKLIDGAKAAKEASLTWYTSMNLDDSSAVVKEFTSWVKKQGNLNVDVSLWRSTSEEVAQRAAIEAQGNRHEFDVIETGQREIAQLGREGIVTKFWVPAVDELPDAAKDKDGTWYGDRMTVVVQAYNTTQIKKEDLPKTWDDLLDPKWKGKMAIESSDFNWFGTLVKGPFGGEQKGLDYFKKLAGQNLQVRSGHTLMAELVASGEIAFALTVYNHKMEQLKKDKAPVDWFVLEPAMTSPVASGTATNAKHPNMALLFQHFLLSLDGQNVINKVGRVPVNPQVKTPLNQGFKMITEDQSVSFEERAKWEKLYDETILKKAQAK